MVQPKCFISYSWDSDIHNGWVRKLAEHLQLNGVEVYLDQWDLRFGMNVGQYMEQSIAQADFVLIVCTPQFVHRANNMKGGVGYEKGMIVGQILSGAVKETKFIPLLRVGEPPSSIPLYLQGKLFIDFSLDNAFQEKLMELLRNIFDSPKYKRPPLGEKPSFDDDNFLKRQQHSKLQTPLLPETYELSLAANNWAAENKPYHHVEKLSSELIGMVRHPPEDLDVSDDPLRGFLLLAALQHGGNWLFWVRANLSSAEAIQIILKALRVSYARVRYRSLYALQLFDSAALNDAITAFSTTLSARAREEIQQYVFPKKVKTYLEEITNGSDRQLAERAKVVVREIELFSTDPIED